MIKENTMCLTDNCFNDREYGDKITYWIDKWDNKRFNAKLLDLCLFCRIKRDQEVE
jgi:hypothetical protein